MTLGMSRGILCSAFCALAAGVGCSAGAGGEPSGGTDAGSFDAGSLDAGSLDAGSLDAGSLDAGSLDAGSLDAGDASPVDPTLQERIDDAVESIQSDTCFVQSDPALCEWADYEVGAAQFNMAKSTGEAILVIDDFGAGLFPELVRYRNRLLGFYRVNGDQVEAQVLSVHLPKRLGNVLVSFAGPEFIPASALSQVAVPIGPAYGKLNLLYLGHGGVIFGHLVELVPEQPLLLLDLAHLFGIPPELCQSLDAQTLAAATAHATAVAASLRQVMTANNVHFINASFGDTAATVAADWANTCAGPAPSGEQLRQVLHVYDPIYDVLFDTEGVITAQAATNLGSPADFPFDQVSALYPNRVRVGFISSLSSGLDEAGRGNVQKDEQFPVDGDADLYLNWGCEGLEVQVCAEPHYQIAGVYGLGSGTMPLMSSSYIDPLGLARLVDLRYANHASEPMSNALIQTLERELTPSLCGASGTQPCVYQDPIAHRQLEPYRLKYE